MEKDSYKVRITEPTVIAPAGGERRHVAAGETIDLSADDAFNVIAGQKGYVVDGQLPNGLKGTPGRPAAR